MKNVIAGTAAAVLIAAQAASAADLGGNCCADLEERVAELEATVARKGNRRLSLEVSGHVNQALFVTDIDGLDKVRIIDNTNSESRFRFRGEARQGAWSAGFLMEIGLGGGDLDVRHQAVYLKVKDLGEVWLGKTSESTDGITEISLAPSDASTLTSLAPFDAVIEDESGLGIVNPFDGYRTETLTFKTGTLLGFQASASWNQGDAWSAALRYAGEFGDVRLAGGIGYRRDELSPDFGAEGKQDTLAGSASIMHTPSGLFLDGAYSESEGVQQIRWNGDTIGLDLDGTKLKLMAGRAGFSKSISAHGVTTIYGEVGQLKVEGMDAKPLFYGLGLSQDITGAAATLYGSWRHYDLDDPDADKANTFLAGVKVRF